MTDPCSTCRACLLAFAIAAWASACREEAPPAVAPSAPPPPPAAPAPPAPIVPSVATAVPSAPADEAVAAELARLAQQAANKEAQPAAAKAEIKPASPSVAPEPIAPAKSPGATGKSPKPTPSPTATPTPSPTPAPAPTPAPTPAPAPKSALKIPSTPHVKVTVPAGLQALLDDDLRMQPWVNRVIEIADACYAKSAAGAKGTIRAKVTMHANERPDADVLSLPPALSGVVACATGDLMRAKRMPLFTGTEGQTFEVSIRFSP